MKEQKVEEAQVVNPPDLEALKQEKAKAFYEEYDALRKKHGFEVGAQTTLTIVEFKPQEIK